MPFFDSIESALEDLRLGKMLIVVDDEDRENEGDFLMPAETATAQALNFMAKEGRGLICTPITEEYAKSLQLNPMTEENDSLYQTAFTISIDAAKNITTGISAFDRAHTIALLNNPETKPHDFVRPGHIFPLTAKKGGVLRRAGHTEAAIDLSRMAGFKEVGVICEILKDDGTMARRDDLFLLAQKYDLKIITIKDLIEYRRKSEKLILKVEEIDFPTSFGHFRLHMYESLVHKTESHVAIVKGDVGGDEPVLVRVHSECFTGDIFGSKRCDCREQLEKAMRTIEKEGRGVVLYMRQEGRGIGLSNKIKAYKLQEEGLDTVAANEKLGFKADLRDYGVGAQILADLGLKKIRLLTNNPKKIVGLEAYNLQIVERVPLEIHANDVNELYLTTKRDKLGHLIMGNTSSENTKH